MAASRRPARSSIQLFTRRPVIPSVGRLNRDRGLPVGGVEEHPHVVPHLEMPVRRDLRKRRGEFSAHLLFVVASQPRQGGFIGERRRKARGQHRVRAPERLTSGCARPIAPQLPSAIANTNARFAWLMRVSPRTYFLATSTREG